MRADSWKLSAFFIVYTWQFLIVSSMCSWPAREVVVIIGHRDVSRDWWIAEYELS